MIYYRILNFDPCGCLAPAVGLTPSHPVKMESTRNQNSSAGFGFIPELKGPVNLPRLGRVMAPGGVAIARRCA